jgi:hypothetical protein
MGRIHVLKIANCKRHKDVLYELIMLPIARPLVEGRFKMFIWLWESQKKLRLMNSFNKNWVEA